MLNWLIYYLIFIAVVLVTIAGLILKLKVRSPYRLIILLIILIVLPVVLSYFIAAYFDPLPETTVPSLVGRSFSEGSQIAEALDLKIKTESQTGNSDIISYQRPEEGRVVKVGRTIFVTLGTRLSDIPEATTPISTFEGEIENPQTSGTNEEME